MDNHVQEDLGIVELLLEFLNFLSVEVCNIETIILAIGHHILIMLQNYLCSMAVPRIPIISDTSYLLYIRHL